MLNKVGGWSRKRPTFPLLALVYKKFEKWDMNINEFFNQLTVGGAAGWAAAAVLILMSLIQISPLKLNPWDNVLTWFGRKINGETQKQLKELQKQVSDIWINAHRQSILTFARECRADIGHDAEEWTNT